MAAGYGKERLGVHAGTLAQPLLDLAGTLYQAVLGALPASRRRWRRPRAVATAAYFQAAQSNLLWLLLL